MLGQSDAADDVILAAKEAGKSFVHQGSISREILERISQPLLPLEAYAGSGE